MIRDPQELVLWVSGAQGVGGWEKLARLDSARVGLWSCTSQGVFEVFKQKEVLIISGIWDEDQWTME